jgi:hypothetical protein
MRLVNMVSISPPGGRIVLPEISLKLSNAAPNSGVPAHVPLTMHEAREWAYAARFLSVWDLNRRTAVFLSRPTARRRSQAACSLSHISAGVLQKRVPAARRCPA